MQLPHTTTRALPQPDARMVASLDSQRWPMDAQALRLGACTLLPAIGGGWVVCHPAAGQAVALCRTLWGACWLVGRLSPFLPGLTDARTWRLFADSLAYRAMLREGDALDQDARPDAPPIGTLPEALLIRVHAALREVVVPGWMGGADDVSRARHAINTVYARRSCQLAQQGIALERACHLAWQELWHAPDLPGLIRQHLEESV
jgi:hypothetical protein